MSFRLFVYGSLLPGQPGCRLAEPFLLERTPGAVMGELYAGEYPFLVPGGGGPVYGEWYLLKTEALAVLDAYEDYYGPGHPDNEYERILITDSGGGLQGWTYAAADGRGYPRIPSGSWLRHLEEAGRL